MKYIIFFMFLFFIPRLGFPQIDYEFGIKGKYRLEEKKFEDGSIDKYEIVGDDSIADYMVYVIMNQQMNAIADEDIQNLYKDNLNYLFSDLDAKICNCTSVVYKNVYGIKCDLFFNQNESLIGILFFRKIQTYLVRLIIAFHKSKKSAMSKTCDQIMNSLKLTLH